MATIIIRQVLRSESASVQLFHSHQGARGKVLSGLRPALNPTPFLLRDRVWWNEQIVMWQELLSASRDWPEKTLADATEDVPDHGQHEITVVGSWSGHKALTLQRERTCHCSILSVSPRRVKGSLLMFLWPACPWLLLFLAQTPPDLPASETLLLHLLLCFKSWTMFLSILKDLQTTSLHHINATLVKKVRTTS